MVAAAAATVAFPAASQSTGGRPPRLVKPRRIAPKALVGIISPGGIVDDALIQKCVANLESQGFTVKPGRNLRAAHGGYAGTVEQRLEDLHAMFADREVAAIWAARGGSGSIALLPRIDYGLVRRNAKALVGYSDITALHLALLRHAGLVTFHGPVASSTFSDFSASHLRAVLMEPEPTRVLPVAPGQSEPRTLRRGTAEGRLAGGNLSLVTALVGTPYGLQGAGSVVFLEEVGEAPYRIDRMLSQLQLAGVTTHAKALAFGVFQRCEATDGEASLTLAEVLEERTASVKAPSVYGLSFGHVPQQVTLPVGIRARLDTEARTLTLLEPSVA